MAHVHENKDVFHKIGVPRDHDNTQIAININTLLLISSFENVHLNPYALYGG